MFQRDKYVLKKRFFSIIGARLDILNSSNQKVFFAEQKAFRLIEDIRLYADKSKIEEFMSIKARKIIDFSAFYDLTDSKTGEKLGALERKPLKSILKEEWIIYNKEDKKIGILQEDSWLPSLKGKFGYYLVTRKYKLFIENNKVADLKGISDLFSYNLELDIDKNNSFIFDPRIVIAVGIMIAFVNGETSSRFNG